MNEDVFHIEDGDFSNVMVVFKPMVNSITIFHVMSQAWLQCFGEVL